MAAGLGFKTFQTGEVLTAADTNGYLMQGVLVFANAAARDAAITSPQEGQCCYLKDTNAVLTYSGTAWVGFDDSNAIQNAIVDAKGDLITATAADTPAILAVGTNGQYLAANSATATGLEWQTPLSGGMTLLSTTALTGASVTVSSISTAYNDLKLVFEDTYSASDGVFLRVRFNGDTGTNYAWENYSTADGQAAGSGVTNADYVQVSKIRNSSTLASDGFVLLSNYTKSAGTIAGISSFSYSDEHVITGGVMYQNAAAITSVTVLMSSGNISGGSLKIYGVK